MIREPNVERLALRRERRVARHLLTAQVYFEDGAAHSARCHLVAALRVIKGERVPRGPKFWELSK